MSILVVIPARYGSTRFEGKPLADILGKPMIVHVWERARSARSADRVLVATDDERIRRAVEAHGGEAVLTSREHPTGTDRVAEVARALDHEIIINVQGDEPLLEPGMVDEVAGLLLDDPEAEMATLMTPIDTDEEFHRPNVVKVVADGAGYALYFSRAPIPYQRVLGVAQPHVHIGIYGYRREFLMAFTRLAPTPLERAESLEQLRALEHGYRIRIAATRFPYAGISVDTPDDIEAVKAVLTRRVRHG